MLKGALYFCYVLKINKGSLHVGELKFNPGRAFFRLSEFFSLGGNGEQFSLSEN